MNHVAGWQRVVVAIDSENPNVAIVSHEDNAELRVEVPIHKTKSGMLLYIDIDMFGVKNILPIDLFEQEVAARLTEEQEILLFQVLGASVDITITNTANVVGVDKSMIRELLALGQRHGIIRTSHNSSWRVINSVTKARWLTAVEKRTKGPKKERTHEDIKAEIQADKRRFRLEEKKVEETSEVIHEDKPFVSCITKVVAKPVVKKESGEQSVADMTKALKALVAEKDERERNNRWDEECSGPWEFTNKMNRLKDQIQKQILLENGRAMLASQTKKIAPKKKP